MGRDNTRRACWSSPAPELFASARTYFRLAQFGPMEGASHKKRGVVQDTPDYADKKVKKLGGKEGKARLWGQNDPGREHSTFNIQRPTSKLGRRQWEAYLAATELTERKRRRVLQNGGMEDLRGTRKQNHEGQNHAVRDRESP